MSLSYYDYVLLFGDLPLQDKYMMHSMARMEDKIGL
jgi:hypothetical protein